MPGEKRERGLRQTTSGIREGSPSKTSELEVRTRGSSMIPLPRAMPHNPKTVKTEKNRLRLIMENNRGLVDALEKERRINVDEDADGYRVSSTREPAAPRYCDLSCNVYRCPVRKVIPFFVSNFLFFSSCFAYHRSLIYIYRNLIKFIKGSAKYWIREFIIVERKKHDFFLILTDE